MIFVPDLCYNKIEKEKANTKEKSGEEMCECFPGVPVAPGSRPRVAFVMAV